MSHFPEKTVLKVTRIEVMHFKMTHFRKSLIFEVNYFQSGRFRSYEFFQVTRFRSDHVFKVSCRNDQCFQLTHLEVTNFLSDRFSK